MFNILGQLSFYGYLTNTNHKYILVKLEDKIEGSQSSDASVKEFFKRLHKIYVNFTSNPFMINDNSTLSDNDKENKEYFEQQLETHITEL